jgi:SAM-dependent methyltransferase
MSFDTLAPYYRGMELVTAGGMLQRCRTAFLAETKNCRHALLLGEGPGRFLVELLQINPRIEVTCVEQSPRMIAEAVCQLRREGLNETRVQFVPSDALTWRPPRAKFDLVATHFFLDCFGPEELERLVANVGEATTAGARWLLTDFYLPRHGWQRWRARAVLALMYFFFRAATGLSASKLTPVDGFLRKAGFRLAGQRFANFGLVHADFWIRDSERVPHPSDVGSSILNEPPPIPAFPTGHTKNLPHPKPPRTRQ